MSRKSPPEQAHGARAGDMSGDTPSDGRTLAEEKVAAADPTLRYALLFLPRSRRDAATALYALWSELREINDECRDAEVARVKLAWWQEEIRQMYAGRPRHPIAAALAPVVAAHRLPVQPLIELIGALAQHAGQTGYLTYEALRVHGTATRGRVESLAVMLAPGSDSETREWASGLGAALELAALLGDTGADAARGRVYLPQEDLMRFGVPAGDLHSGRATEAVRRLIAFEAERLAAELMHDLAIVPPAQRGSLLAPLTAAGIARALLDGVRRRPERVLRERPRLAPLRQLWIAWRSARRSRVS